MLFGMPVAQILLFGFALTNEIKNSKIVICDYANDANSKRITNKIESSSNFEINSLLMSHREIEDSFRKGDIKLAVIFPANFSKELSHSGKSHIQIIADASDPNTGNTLTNYVNSIIRDYQLESSRGLSMPLRINTEIRMLYNPELIGATNFVPGVMALVLLLICVLMTSVSIVREKEIGTMEQLMVTPMRPIEFILGKSLPFAIICFIDVIVVSFAGMAWFKIPIRGSMPLLLFAAMLFLMSCIGIGLLISTISKTQQEALMSSFFFYFPAVLLSGFMFPISNMPTPVQWMTTINPLRYFLVIIRGIFLKGTGLAELWTQLVALALLGVFFLLFSVSRFKKTID